MKKQQSQFLNSPMESGRQYSDDTAKLIDREVQEIIDTQYKTAVEVLKARKELLEEWARKLLRDEVIEGPELDNLQAAVTEKQATPVNQD